MPSNDVFWFKLDEKLVAHFDEANLVDFDWEDYVKYDEGLEIKIKAKNVSYEMDGKKDFKAYSEIPARLVHSKGDAIALSPGAGVRWPSFLTERLSFLTKMPSGQSRTTST